MLRLRVMAFAFVLASAATINLTLSPQIMTARAPIFSGADIAQSYEWRAMGIFMHSWWLYRTFPSASVHHVGFVRPSGEPDSLETGIKFSSWIDRELGLDVDSSEPPYDIEEFDVRDELLSHAKHYSRIHCRDNQPMVKRDSCYYVVVWDENTVGESPTFVGVRTKLVDNDNSEYFLVEESLLLDVLGVSLDSIPTIHDTDS